MRKIEGIHKSPKVVKRTQPKNVFLNCKLASFPGARPDPFPIMRYELEDSYDWGDFPPDEAYFCDAQWGL